MDKNQFKQLFADLMDAYQSMDEASKAHWKERMLDALNDCKSDEILVREEGVQESNAFLSAEEDNSLTHPSATNSENSPSAPKEELTSKMESQCDDEEASLISDNSEPVESVPLLENAGAQNQAVQADEKTAQEEVAGAFHPLANAVVGSHYEESILDFEPDEGLRVESINETVSLEELGLTVHENVIFGIPTQPGEYRFLVSSDSRARKEFVVLLVNPDPKSLWKNLEPPPDAPYPKAHFDSTYLTLEEDSVRIVAGSMRGRSHAHSGTHRDDDFLVVTISPGLYCLAVADGAGSAPLSREGSRLACAELERLLRSTELKSDLESLQSMLRGASAETLSQMNQEAKRELSETMYRVHLALVQGAINRIQEEVELNPGSALRDFSTTLLYSIIVKADGGFVTMNYGIGDGVIAHVQSERIKLLNTPDGGEYSGQTRFLTMSDSIQELAKRMNMAFVEKLDGLFLMTDGVSDPKFETDSQLTDLAIWGELQAELLSEASNVADEDVSDWLEEWLSFWSPGNHDDRTIVFVHGFNLELSRK